MADGYASIGVSSLPMPQFARGGFAAQPSPPATIATAARTFRAGRAEGGATRPLTGLLHPPGRRGNRAPA